MISSIKGPLVESARISSLVLVITILAGCTRSPAVIPTAMDSNSNPDFQVIQGIVTPVVEIFDPARAFARIPEQKDSEPAAAFLQQLDQGLIDQTRQAAGLSEVLGDQAAEVFARMDRARAAALQQWAAESAQSARPRLQTVAWRNPAPARPGIAQPKGAGFPQFIVALSPGGFADKVIDWEKKFKDKFPDLESGTATEVDGVKSTMIVSKRLEGDSLVVDAKLTSSLPLTYPPGATLEETIRGTIKVKVCPDPAGIVQGSLSIVASSAFGSSASGETKIISTISGQVNDEAELTGYTNQISASTRMIGTSPNGNLTGLYGEVQMEFTFDMNSGERSIAQTRGGEMRRSSKMPDSMMNAFTEKAVDYILWLDIDVMREAEKLWRNGYCVEVVVLEPPGGSKGGVAPGSENPVTADVRHRRGGGEVKAPIEARLTYGEVSVAPDGQRVPSPAAFTYTAPPEIDKGATVDLRTISKRGIGSGEAHFDTYPPDYQITVKVSGSATEIDKYYTYSRTVEANFTVFVHPNSSVEAEGSGELRVAEVFTEPYSPCSSDLTVPATLHVFAGINETDLVLSMRTDPLWMNVNCWWGPVEVAPYFVAASAYIKLDGTDPAVTVFTQDLPFSSDGINLVLTWEVTAKREE